MAIVSPYITGKEERIDTGRIAVIDENLAYKIFQKLLDAADDDERMPLTILLNDFIYLSQGVFKHKTSELCLLSHEFFRRSQSRFNTFHFFFLDALMNLANSPE